MANNLSALLEREGFAVITEPDGRWALRVFEKRRFDLVILGAMSGPKGGMALAEGIRKTARGKDTPMVMVAESSRSRSILKAAQRTYQLADLFEKPIRPKELLSTLRTILGSAYPNRAEVESARQAVDNTNPRSFAGPDSERERKEVEHNSTTIRRTKIKGSLAETPFPELLGQLYQKKSSGALLLQREGQKKVVYLKGGYPMLVKSNRPEECLGRSLVRSGLISQEQCTESLQRMKSSGRQQGTVLVGMGLLSPSSLRRVLVSQLQMKLFSPFAWPDGSYSFDPRSEVPPASVQLEITPATLIHRGIKRRLDLGQLRERLVEHKDHWLIPNPDPALCFQALTVEPADAALLESCQNDRQLAEIVAGARDAERAMLALVYTFKCTGMFIFSQEAPAGNSLDDPDTWQGATATEVDTFEPYEPGEAIAQPLPPPPVAKPMIPQPPPLEPEAGELEAEEPSAPTHPHRELTRVRRGLADELSQKKEQDFFELLDVGRTADSREIDQAFRMLARRFHPDHSTNFGSTQVRRLNVEMFELICRAHNTLSDDSSRQEYLTSLEQGALPEPEAHQADNPVNRALRAESLYNQSEQALKNKDFTTAQRLLEEVVKLCPDEGEYRAQLGLAMFRSNPDNTTVVRTARDELNQAIMLSPRLDRAHLHLGYIYKRMGQRAMSVHEFEQALVCNPKCAEAIRELRLLRSRGKKQKKGLGGLLSKWRR